jgi:hypothetical protein
MPTKLNGLLAATATAAAAGAIVIAGVTAAGASASSPVISGTENFQFMTTSPTSGNVSIIATGVFTAGGVDHPGHTADTLVFRTGSVTIAHSNPTGTHTLNPKTCLVTASETGTYKITGGTGAYAGITGNGTYRLTILAVAARNTTGKCSTTLAPAAWQQVIKGSGPVHL